jgi:hypothetical protein
MRELSLFPCSRLLITKSFQSDQKYSDPNKLVSLCVTSTSRLLRRRSVLEIFHCSHCFIVGYLSLFEFPGIAIACSALLCFAMLRFA